MNCEYCKSEHEGNFGKGRFCNASCAAGFATSEKRKEINTKVSLRLKGRKSNGYGFKKGFDPRRCQLTKEHRQKAGNKIKAHKAILWEAIKVKITNNELVTKRQLRRFLIETVGFCQNCGFITWLGKPLVLELHHEDGDPKHHRISNSKLLCPNCHSQTPNFRNKYRCGEVET